MIRTFERTVVRMRTNVPRVGIPALLSLIVLPAWSSASFAEIALEPTWHAPSYEEVRTDVLVWVQKSDLTNAQADRVKSQWAAAPTSDQDELDLLGQLAATFAEAYPQARELVRACSSDYAGPTPPTAQWLSGGNLPALVRDNLRLYHGRWLAQHGLYDESLAALEGLQPGEVADPACLLFYRAVACHQLVQPDAARAAIVRLLEQRDRLPRRYLQVAQLLERDLAGLEDESLDHIARRMNDTRRRLGYGRAGENVQNIEKGIVESLDKKIEQLEKQQQQQQAQQSQGGGSSAPMQPMQNSMPAEQKGPMQVDQRDIGYQAGWGNLPPKERERALQQFGREFPSQYREVIEQYFRELANQSTGADALSKETNR